MNEELGGGLRQVIAGLRRAVSTASVHFRRLWSAGIVRLHEAALSAALFGKRFIGNIRRRLRRFSISAPGGYAYYRHPLPVRIMHWCNVVFLAILLMSGLGIFNAHPTLYWGKQSYGDSLRLLEMRGGINGLGEASGVTRIWGHEFDTTGFLGASRDPAGEWAVRGFPSWLTIPDWQWLAMARRWHLFFAWLLVVNGLAFVVYAFVSRHLRHDLVPTGPDWRSIGRTMIDHLRFRHPRGEASKRYNVLQKCAYLAVVFFLLPGIILMGFGMSPGLNALFTGWVDLFSGRQSVRTIHFALAWTVVLFAIVHVFMVIVSGFWNNLRSMVTGYYRVESEADDG